MAIVSQIENPFKSVLHLHLRQVQVSVDQTCLVQPTLCQAPTPRILPVDAALPSR